MGRLGEHFALGVYLGSEGLAGLCAIQSDQVRFDSFDALGLQKMVMASFEDRVLLRDADLKIIRQLGPKPRGHNAWPLFRSYRPGYQPWHVNGDEARFLTLGLQQAIQVAVRFRNDPALLRRTEEMKLLVRIPRLSSEGTEWHDDWLDPPPFEVREKTFFQSPSDAEAIMEACPPGQSVWEVDYSYTPAVIRDKAEDRPFLPIAILFVDHTSARATSRAVPCRSQYHLMSCCRRH